MTKAELDKILDGHRLYLTSNGESGSRAILDGAILDGASLENASLDGAILRRASLVGASLENASLENAILVGAILDGAILRRASLDGAILRRASLDGAILDFSAWPLSCGGLSVHIDDRLATQLLYHLVQCVQYSKNTSPEIKALIVTPALVDQANKFHRTDVPRITITAEAEA